MIYFVSDIHLGLSFNGVESIEREKLFYRFLSSIEGHCTELFLVGDIFDFWFEWRAVVPQGYVRVLGKLATMVDSGIKIHFFTGNHDLWVESYLRDGIGLTIHKEPYVIERCGKKLFITHGDSLYKYSGISRVLEVIFRSRVAKWLSQRLIHPDFMCRFGHAWSRSNRQKRGDIVHVFDEHNDLWVQYCKEFLSDTQYSDVNYFIYGHLHLALVYDLQPDAQMVVLGEWVYKPTYGTLSGTGEFQLHSFE